MKIKNRNRFFLVSLVLLTLIASILYLTINHRNHLNFTLTIRIPKLLAFILVAICTSFSTVTFQTITNNQLLTPSIIGIDSLFVLFQTVLVFITSLQVNIGLSSLSNFILSTLLTALASVSFLLTFFRVFPGRIFLLLLFGLVFNTFTESIQTFLQVVMDPNDFTAVLSQTLTSFSQVNTSLLSMAALVTIPFVFYLYSKRNDLDVIHLGTDYATSLGLQVNKQFLIYFISVSIITATATSLVGPTSFIGFLGANIAYRLFSTYRHQVLFLGSTLIALLFILGGQIIVEYLFQTQTTLSVVINFIGGIYFIFLLLTERRAPL